MLTEPRPLVDVEVEVEVVTVHPPGDNVYRRRSYSLVSIADVPEPAHLL